jgi:hypothetical protein
VGKKRQKYYHFLIKIRSLSETAKSALRLTLWNDRMAEEKKTEKSNNKTHKKIEHGGENSYHALCCVFEVLEDYRKGRG